MQNKFIRKQIQNKISYNSKNLSLGKNKIRRTCGISGEQQK